jgi:hypothetical protein
MLWALHDICVLISALRKMHDEIEQGLISKSPPVSVRLSGWPPPNRGFIDKILSFYWANRSTL